MKHREGDAPPEKDPGEQTITGMIRDLLADEQSRETIIDRIEQVLTDDDRRRAVRIWVNSEIRKIVNTDRAASFGHQVSHRFNEARSEERSSFITHAHGFYTDDSDPGDRLSRRAEILDSSFTIPTTGEIVRFGSATVEQHRAQQEWCEKITYKAGRSAHEHARAISEIRAAGLATLDEVAALRHANEKAIEPPKVAA